MDIFDGEFTHLFKGFVRPSVLGNGLGVELELRVVERMGHGSAGLLSGKDEVRATLFVFAIDFSDEETAESVASGNPA